MFCFRNLQPIVSSYSNASDKVTLHKEVCLGFGNSLPVSPLKKVEAGKKIMEEICRKFSKVHSKDELIVNLVQLLKDGERSVFLLLKLKLRLAAVGIYSASFNCLN